MRSSRLACKGNDIVAKASLSWTFAAFLLAPFPSPATDRAAGGADIDRILDEGFNHSEAEKTAAYLTDRIGSRVTNSPGMRAAEDWTSEQLKSWGLKNSHKEAVPFGRGWSMLSSQVAMLAPRPLQLKAIPVAWTPGTNGTITAPIVFAPMEREADLERWRGKLAGKIVLISPPGAVAELTQPIFRRWTAEELTKLGDYRPATRTPAAAESLAATANFPPILDRFLKSEGALAWIKISREDYKAIHGEGEGYLVGQTPALPALEMAAEDYRRLVRLAADGTEPTLTMSTAVRYEDGDSNAHNVIADIPGSDSHAGYVMVGAHLDSWHAADGAMDDGAGVTITMEAARILSKLGVHPKRTIRFALFAGEEEGLVGSRAYVAQHIASRPIDARTDINGMARMANESFSWPLTPKAGYADIKAYFNLDIGSGRIRGASAFNSITALPLLKEWLSPFEKLGVTSFGVGAGDSGSDMTSFLDAGIPSVSFTPDYRDILSLHHTDSDTFDHLSMQDLHYNAVIIAGLLLNAANSEISLPALPMPRPNTERAP
jgi:carboxypeptidase Q